MGNGNGGRSQEAQRDSSKIDIIISNRFNSLWNDIFCKLYVLLRKKISSSKSFIQEIFERKFHTFSGTKDIWGVIGAWNLNPLCSFSRGAKQILWKLSNIRIQVTTFFNWCFNKYIQYIHNQLQKSGSISGGVAINLIKPRH